MKEKQIKKQKNQSIYRNTFVNIYDKQRIHLEITWQAINLLNKVPRKLSIEQINELYCLKHSLKNNLIKETYAWWKSLKTNLYTNGTQMTRQMNG